MRHEWLITSAECVDAKRRRREQSEPPSKSKSDSPSPGFSGEHRLPEDEQTSLPEPNPEQQKDEQPVGFPQ